MPYSDATYPLSVRGQASKPAISRKFFSRMLPTWFAYGLANVVLAVFALIGYTTYTAASVPVANPAGPSVPLVGNSADTAKPACQTAPASALIGQPFAQCPSFVLDFASMPDGPFQSDHLVAYQGKPESNDEAQYYTANPQNIRIEKGALTIQALKQVKDGHDYTSARVDTKGKQDFLYGRIVVRSTMPAGTGTWPAIWMLSSKEKYRQFNPPESGNHDMADGEMDIAEAVGTEPHKVYGIAHSLTSWTGLRDNYYSTVTLPDNHAAYHDYELRWTPDRLVMLVDGMQYYSVDKKAGADYKDWPYDQPYYLIINLALGGSWGGRDRVNFPKDGVDPAALPATMRVESIKYYPYTGPK